MAVNARRWILGLLLLFALSGAGFVAAVRTKVGSVGVRLRIAAAVAETAPGAVIDMTAIAPFKWDQLHVLGPYTARDVVKERAALPAPIAWAVGLEKRDDICLLVLTEGGQYRAHIAYPRTMGDFAPMVRAAPYPRAEARFLVKERAGQGRDLFPAPQGP